METSKEEKIVILNNNDILPNRFQPRKKFSEDDLLDLTESIKKYGVLEPIIVRPLGDKYELIAGERRYKANVLAGNETIPAIIKDLDDAQSSEVAIIENLQRKDLSALEEALSYKRVIDLGYGTQHELAEKLGKSQSYIANKIRLLKLSDKVQDALLDNKISERHARSLLRIDSLQKQDEMLDRIINERLTVRRTDEEIDKMNNGNMNNNFNEGGQLETTPLSTIFNENQPINENGVFKFGPETMDNNVQPDLNGGINQQSPMFNNPFINVDNDESDDASGQQNVLTPKPLDMFGGMQEPSEPQMQPMTGQMNMGPQPFNFGGMQEPSEPQMQPMTGQMNMGPQPFNFGGMQEPSEPQMQPMGNEMNMGPQPFNFGNIQEPSIPQMQPMGNEMNVGPQPFNFGGMQEPSEPQMQPMGNEMNVGPQPFNFGGIQESSEPQMQPKGGQMNVGPQPFNFGGIQESSEPQMQPMGGQMNMGPQPFNFGGIQESSEPQMQPMGNEMNMGPQPFNFGGMQEPSEPQMQPMGSGMNMGPQPFNFGGMQEPSMPQTKSIEQGVSPEPFTLNNNDNNTVQENNGSIPQTPIFENNQQNDTIAEFKKPDPIIVTDYSKQYDPVMPEQQQTKTPDIDFKTIINLIRQCSDTIEKCGYKIDTEEYDLENMYQVVFKINKN